MKINQNTRDIIIANAKRVIELVNNDETFADGYWGNPKKSELVCKAKELRRDTLRLEKEMRE